MHYLIDYTDPKAKNKYMARYTSPALKDWRFPMVRLACRKCDRKGQYQKQTLIGKFGGGVVMRDLREKIAQCERHGRLGKMRVGFSSSI